jgi:DNA helicase-2/ATP-dependent DNA helicase PcrA
MSFLDELNPVQREAVRAVNGPVMIVAGAGSGKTRVLTYRAAYLVQLGVPPESVLALTFTNKAADEMKGRIAALVGQASRRIWMGTFHSIFARILRTECEHLGYTRNFSIYDTDDSLSLIKNIMGTLSISQQQYSPQGIRARISSAKNQMISVKTYMHTAMDPMAERTAAVYDAYERRLRQSNAMDFDDLLLKPLELFARSPDILERYHYRFKYILVDEYQDTNRVQYLMIKELAKRHRNICVVGDDAQSIYAFRGADIRNILDFEKDYPECQVFRLEQNYRSTKSILALADSVIKHNIDQISKKLWTDNADGEQVTLVVCDDDREEGYRIASVIQEEARKKKLDLRDFAVLYRTNAQSRSVEDALRRNGIPYTIVGGVEFYKRKEIKDILAYLKVVANPLDEESLLRIINVPARSIGATTIEKLVAFAGKHKVSLFDALASALEIETIAERTAASARRFHTMMRKYIALKKEMSVSELARALVDEIGILQTLKAENTSDSLTRRENIQELVSALTEFNDLHPDARLEDFLEEVSLLSDVDATEFGHNAVTLMTLHAAKGLEFPVVLIAGLEEGLFPLAASSMDNKQLEEERRLFYVGITRAMRKLYLLYGLARYKYGEFTYSVKSRFLDELDDSVLKVENATVRKQMARYRRVEAKAGGDLRIPRRTTRTNDEQAYTPDRTPKYEDESQDIQQPHVGAQVYHESFGKGRVVALNGEGDNARALVDFDSVGPKQLMLKYAHLRNT